MNRLLDRLTSALASLFQARVEKQMYTAVMAGAVNGAARAYQELTGEELDVEPAQIEGPKRRKG